MSDERTLHRLEAFSDIVIGFSLAQLGAALMMNHKTMTLDPMGVIAFFGAFAIICSLWFFHHRLFDRIFVPKTLPVILNFLWLAIVVLLAYTAVQFAGPGFAYRNLDLLYFGLYAMAYGILAVQLLLGMRESVDAAVRARGVRSIVFMTLWTCVFAVCFALLYVMPPTAVVGALLNVVFAAGGLCTIALGIYFRRSAKAAGQHA